MDSSRTIEALRVAARALNSSSDREAVKAFQTAQDALDAAKADRLASLQTSRDFELDGASTLSTWVRNELRLSAKDASTLVSAAATLAHLPAVAEAAAAGQIRSAHVATFTYGLKHIGHKIVTDSEAWLLEVAKTCEPNELFRVIRALRDAIYPEGLDKELDRDWAKGMDKQDLQVNAVPAGFSPAAMPYFAAAPLSPVFSRPWLVRSFRLFSARSVHPGTRTTTVRVQSDV